jgi:hypothetical protein
MVGELITLPLRISVGATRLWIRATGETVAVVADATGKLIDKATGNRAVAMPVPPTAPKRDISPSEPAVAPSEPTVARSEPAAPSEPTVAPSEPAVAPAEPVHVSEEPELVEEIAEPGAEDGAGAAIHVDEPWKGYEQMRAEDVIDRLAGTSTAELAAIQLYESGNRGRVTVLDAVKRELQISSNSGSHS